MKYLLCLLAMTAIIGCQQSSFHDYVIQNAPPPRGTANIQAATISIDNCLYTSGMMIGQVDFGNNISLNPSPIGVTRRDLFIEKFDQNNTPVFARLFAYVSGIVGHGMGFTINISDMTSDDACNIYISGNFSGGNLQLQPNAFVNSLVCGGETDGFFAKLDPKGNLIWIRQIGGTGLQIIKSIKTEGKDVYIAGFFNSSTNFLTQQVTAGNGLNGFYCRYRQQDGLPGPNGWENIIKINNPTGQEQFSVEDLDINKDSVLIAGVFKGSYIFSGTVKIAQQQNGYFAKAGKDGIIHSITQLESLNNNSVFSLQSGFLDANGGVVCSGSYAGAADFDPGPATVLRNSTGGLEDLFVAAYDNANRHTWVNVYGSAASEQNCKIKKDAQQQIFVMGDYNGTVNFGIRTLHVNGTTIGGAFILKLQSTGLPIWIADAQYRSAGLIGITGFAASPNRNRMVAGIYVATNNIIHSFSGARSPQAQWNYLTFYGH